MAQVRSAGWSDELDIQDLDVDAPVPFALTKKGHVLLAELGEHDVGDVDELSEEWELEFP